MVRFLAIGWLVWLLCGLATAQEAPVEIELVPPGPDVTFTTIPVPVRSEWKAPLRLCAVCKERAAAGGCSCYHPLTQASALGLLDEVTGHLTRISSGALALKQPVSIKAVSSARLRGMGGERLLGLYQDGVLYVSHDLNRRQARGVVAHEYGHAWFFQNRSDINGASELLFEGFAEFVSYLVLREVGDEAGVRAIEFTDQSVYGRGARRLIKLYRQQGLEAVLQQARGA